ncbi:MAG: sulfur oxidation c-type cytochrome SoxX [Thiohalobacteraceae bacterium]|nr:sulfur oxidation c-type cytochrome SoxX [Gammaproteobacteria bacterium]
MANLKTHAAALAVLVPFVSIIGGGAIAETDPAKGADYTAMTPEQLADYLIFDANGFVLDAKTQEGGVSRDRMIQDEIQKICSASKDAPLDSETQAKVIGLAQASIVYPEDGIKLGDWKKGNEVARSGYGFRIGHRVDDHSKEAPGGNCYACHEMDPQEFTFGTVGLSLKNYGKLRGTSEQILKYTYDMIYNAHAYFPCTRMPRFGSNGVLTQEQIRDVMAYLLDPESPVNQ